jgi:hypothetical protein
VAKRGELLKVEGYLNSGQSPVGALCGIYLNLRLARTKSEGPNDVQRAWTKSGRSSRVRCFG